MHRALAPLVVMAVVLAACGDDSDDGDDEGTTPPTTAAEVSEDDSVSGTDGNVETFCDEYQAALIGAENPASVEQFEGLTPPDELAGIWEEYLDNDWDAGVTVDGFIADNCF